VVALNTQSRFPKSGNLGAVGCALLMALSAVAMTGCGGGGDDAVSQAAASNAEAPPVTSPPATTPDPTPPASSTENQKPTISGSAPTAVTANSAYSFVPKAVDADGDSLTFSIQNKPSWASFSTATGKLSGTPGAAEVGTYSNIAISVSDGKASSAMSFSISVTAIATGRVTLQWAPPTENTDNTALTDLAGYKIHYGTNPSALSQTVSLDNSGLTAYVVENLSPGTWYFAITAVTAAGTESNYSNVANKTI
jgi:hypothetical protein